jgi:hypothetical protein
MLRCGRAKAAAQWHLKGYRQAVEEDALLGVLADHIAFLAVTENRERAMALFRRRFARALKTHHALNRLQFVCAGLLLMRELLRNGDTAVRLRVPKEWDEYRPDDTYEVVVLQRWLHDQAVALASTFDQRNGNDHYTGVVHGFARLQQMVRPLPIGVGAVEPGGECHDG